MKSHFPRFGTNGNTMGTNGINIWDKRTKKKSAPRWDGLIPMRYIRRIILP